MFAIPVFLEFYKRSHRRHQTSPIAATSWAVNHSAGTAPQVGRAQELQPLSGGGGECPWGAQSRPGLRLPAPLGPGNAAHSATCWREPRAQLGCCSCIRGLRYQLQVVFISTILLLALLTLLCFPLPLVSLPGELLTGWQGASLPSSAAWEGQQLT